MSAPERVDPAFGELDAARLYVRLVSDRDPEPFLACLSQKVRYQSHWVLADLCGEDDVARLLRAKVRAASEKGPPFPQARLGVSTRTPGRPLAILMDRETGEAQGTVTFEVVSDKIVSVSICVLGWEKPALLEHPDSYFWSQPEGTTAQRATPMISRCIADDRVVASDATSNEESLELDLGNRQTTGPLFAPISDLVIAERRERTYAGTTVTLLSPDDDRLACCNFPGLDEAREAARRGDIVLLMLSRSGETIGVVTCPRSKVPWSSVTINELGWLMRDCHRLSRYFDFDSWNELVLFAVLPLIRGAAVRMAEGEHVPS